MKNKKRMIIFFAVVVMFIALVICVCVGNKALTVSEYKISSDKIAKAFDGYKIAQVSDLHNTEIGKDNEKLIEKLRETQPDIIAITGDVIDSRNTDKQVALDFIEQALTIAPCYYVSGNHESRIDSYKDFKTQLEELGVEILDDEKIVLEKSNAQITLAGVNDPSFETDYLFGESKAVMNAKLNSLVDEDGYSILLSHRPELFECYQDAKVDLVLSGHTHGGQFVVPFVGGLVAPNQGFFPEYDYGLFTQGSTNMIVSRGVGNSIFPFRVNNRPEIVVVQLQYKK